MEYGVLQDITQLIPTAYNLLPIRLDLEIDGHRFREAFTWNPSDPDSEVVVFAKRTVKDLNLPPAFITQIAQSIQLTDFRSYEGQDMYTGEKIVPIKIDLRVNRTLIKDQFLWDLNNFESDPEEFARIFCRDLGIDDPEVGPEIAFAIREQLYEIAVQYVSSARESRLSKKGRRGFELPLPSKAGGTGLDVMKLYGFRSSVIRVVAGFVASMSSGGGGSSSSGALVAMIIVEKGTSFSKWRFDCSYPRSIGRRRSHSFGSRL